MNIDSCYHLSKMQGEVKNLVLRYTLGFAFVLKCVDLINL